MGLKCNGKKASYNDKYDADKKIKDIFRKGDVREYTPIRSYKCECGKWHLTSVEKSVIDKQIKKINERVKKRQDSFINREAKYWQKRYGINPDE